MTGPFPFIYLNGSLNWRGAFGVRLRASKVHELALAQQVVRTSNVVVVGPDIDAVLEVAVAQVHREDLVEGLACLPAFFLWCVFTFFVPTRKTT